MAEHPSLPEGIWDQPLRLHVAGNPPWVVVQWCYVRGRRDPMIWLVDLERRECLGRVRRERKSAWVAEVFAAEGRTVVWSHAFPPGGLDVESAARAAVMRCLAVLPLDMSVYDAEVWQRVQANATPGA